MGSKMAFAFANIFKADNETQIFSQSVVKTTVSKRYIDDIFFSVGQWRTRYTERFSEQLQANGASSPVTRYTKQKIDKTVPF